MKIAALALGFFSLVSVGLVVWLAASGTVDDISTITYEAAVQVLVVAAIGHAVSFVVTKIGYDREELRSKNEYRKSILDRLNEAFFDVKRVRRLIRTRNKRPGDLYPSFISKDEHSKTAEIIIDIQLRLEGIAKDVENSGNLFEKDYSKLKEHVDNLEGYLNKLVDEFEHVCPTPTGTPPEITLTDTPELNDLLGDYRSSKFRKSFVHPYYASCDIIRSKLLHSDKTRIASE